ncbi:[protein-PII] uridylyltransferase [Uliginosibacterium gangwonense]|uniref:[protein-PII] uridylyltransferase n=1 Tax=Uliginosibacterium gangwonense TaxID=392736 RepID=UPI00035D0319|nr:[protein-PII] uridylyltransferase [Uliginosibacterium gangwonense]
MSNDSPDTYRQQLEALRKTLANTQLNLRGEYEAHHNPARLLRGRCCAVDLALQDMWALHAMPPQLCLIAVGGYGRGELFPYSDVDILVLLDAEPETELASMLERFIGSLWDLGLDIGHSVRTVEACIEEARQDITIQTNLLESRLLVGNKTLYRKFIAGTTAGLEPESYFHAKRAEQEQRYNRFNHTPYALEPNCKESPGGLRDLQSIIWIALSAGLGTRWSDLARQGLITNEEVRELRAAERFMQQVRIKLHYIAKRREDRLVFDHQEALAEAFGIKAGKSRRASELMMQRYFHTARKITQLNTILLQNIAVRYQPLGAFQAQPLNEHFQIQGDLLDIVGENIFECHPSALLESFLLMEQHPELTGMSARTLRALWRGRKLIDAKFRHDPANNALFLQLLQEPRGQTHEFRRLNQYSILGSYIPAFARIVGQMQHDLFHVYTVDQHILQVLRNVRRFALEEHAHEYPLLTRLMSGFERNWLIYVAALFHDIAKGRGGDHSKLGMADTRRFCRQHKLSKEDIDLVVWLVEHHLTMSHVAQKQDLANPDVIRKFVALVGDERHLNALYILTHADIRGTSPKVWNGWKAQLLEDLFLASRQLLRGNMPEQVFGIAERQEAVRQRLRFHGLRPQTEENFWRELDTLYFLRHDAEEITWHTRVLYYRPQVDSPVVKARLAKVEKGIQIMVYMRDEKDLFARMCGAISRMGFSIVDAKIHTTAKGFALDSFIIMDPNEAVSYRDVISLVEHNLAEKLSHPEQVDTPVNTRPSRQLKHFPIAPSITLQPDERGQHFILSIVAADRPGLLYTVARTLTEHGINLHTAKIATLGERAEDTFMVSGPALDNSARTVQLEAALIERLK